MQQLALVIVLHVFHWYGFVCGLVMLGMSMGGLSFCTLDCCRHCSPATCIFYRST